MLNQSVDLRRQNSCWKTHWTMHMQSGISYLIPIQNDLLSGQVYSCICCQACDGRQQTVAPSSGHSWSRAETRNYFLCRGPTRLQTPYVSVWWCTPVTDQPIHSNSTQLPNIYFELSDEKTKPIFVACFHNTRKPALLLCQELNGFVLTFKLCNVHKC